MILVDTSIWISHFKHTNLKLQQLLEAGEVATHPYVLGELVCGGIINRAEIFSLLQELPAYSPISSIEFLHFVQSYSLAAQGIGFVDVHLLASAVLNSDFLWTLDKKLALIAANFQIAFV